MVGLHHHHEAKHARRHQEAGGQAGGPVPGLPERFWPLRDHAEKVARGEWVDPALEDMIAALRRDFGVWQQEQRNG